MSLIEGLLNTTTVVGPIGTTAFNCFDHEEGLKFKYNAKKTKNALKKSGTTAVALTATSSLQYCDQASSSYLDDLYAEALSVEQIEQMEELLAAKENEFTVNGVAYRLDEVDMHNDSVSMGQLENSKEKVKTL